MSFEQIAKEMADSYDVSLDRALTSVETLLRTLYAQKRRAAKLVGYSELDTPSKAD